MIYSDIKITPLQNHFLTCQEKYLGLFGGVGNGKTNAGCLALLTDALQVPNGLFAMVRNTFPQLRGSTLDVMIRLLKRWDPSKKWWRLYEGSKLQIELYNGAVIRLCHTANIDDFLGPNYNSVYIDQAEQVDEQIFQAITGRIRAAGGRNRVILTGNPAGVDWVYQFFDIGSLDEAEMQQAIKRDGWHEHISGHKSDNGQIEVLDRRMITAPTFANVNNLPKDYIESMIRSNGKEWVKRFVDGSWFLTDSGVWDVSKVRAYQELPKIVASFVGIDPAFSERDAACDSAIVVIGCGDDGYLYVLDVRHGKWRTKKLLEEIFDVADTYEPQVMGIEDVAGQRTLIDVVMSELGQPSSGDVWAGDNPREGDNVRVEAIKIGAQDKYKRARAVSYLVDNDKLRCNYKPLIDQMSSFAAEKTDGKDLVDALVHALKMCQLYGPVIKIKKDVDTKFFDPYYATNKSIIDNDKRLFARKDRGITIMEPISITNFNQ